jgi:hypothetical protein
MGAVGWVERTGRPIASRSASILRIALLTPEAPERKAVPIGSMSVEGVAGRRGSRCAQLSCAAGIVRDDASPRRAPAPGPARTRSKKRLPLIGPSRMPHTAPSTGLADAEADLNDGDLELQSAPVPSEAKLAEGGRARRRGSEILRASITGPDAETPRSGRPSHPRPATSAPLQAAVPAVRPARCSSTGRR